MIYSLCYIFTQCVHFCREGSFPPPSLSRPSKPEISKNFHIIDNAVLKSLLPLKITLLHCSLIVQSTAKSLPCSTGLLETPPCREPQKTPADKTFAHEIGWLAHISQANGHSNNRWEQSSSPRVCITCSTKVSRNSLFFNTRVTGLCLRSSQTEILTFRGTFPFSYESAHMTDC